MAWLWARLKWSLELSELTIFHISPKSQIHYLTQKPSFFNPTIWNYDDDQLSFVISDQTNIKLTMYKFLNLSQN